jgi:Domain of Unknown Function (DUF1080)
MSFRLSVALAFCLLAVAIAGCEGKPQVKYQIQELSAAAGQTAEWTFDKDESGKPLAGAQVFSGTWEVRAADDAPSKPNILAQTATADFPALRLGDKVYADLDATVRFKPVSGKDDQAAGIIFRVQDKDNYCILRANALEDNVIFFRYGSGSRSTLKEGSVKVPSGQWQELKLEARGNRFRGFLNGQLVVETTDDAYKAGGIGLWTKADSVTYFDDVRVSAR